MEELLNNIWVQAGAAGLFSISGWAMWWLERKERLATQQKLDTSLERFITFMNDYKDLLEKVTEGLAVQKLLEEKFNKLNRS